MALEAPGLQDSSVPSEYPAHDLDFLSRVEELDKDADLVVFFGRNQ